MMDLFPRWPEIHVSMTYELLTDRLSCAVAGSSLMHLPLHTYLDTSKFLDDEYRARLRGNGNCCTDVIADSSTAASKHGVHRSGQRCVEAGCERWRGQQQALGSFAARERSHRAGRATCSDCVRMA